MKTYVAILTTMLMATGLLAKELTWETDYEKALTTAKNSNKIVMVDVYTDWCGWCKKLDRDVYSNNAVQEKLANGFVAVKINPEKSGKNRQFAQKHGTRGYPHIVFLDVSGNKIDEIQGYLPADRFTAALERVAQKARK
jgi:thioredoxin-related protein